MTDQLDISIQSADKFLTEKRIDDFLKSRILVEHKTDGVKLTVIKKANNGNIDDFIFAYKGNILFKDEYNYQSDENSKLSFGCSQFKTVFQHFRNICLERPEQLSLIPNGTELFIEFLMKKPTLSSNYSDLQKMVLIGYSQSEYKTYFGKLKTSNSGMCTELRDEYANILNIDTPQVLFDGFFAKSEFVKGIIHPELKLNYENANINWDEPKEALQTIKRLFLQVKSKYGGLEEGVVLKTDNNILKWQQEYQLDQNARFQIKQQYREDDQELETQYWENIKNSAFSIIESITFDYNFSSDINASLNQLSEKLKSFNLTFGHSKKPDYVIKDDIQLNCKSLIIKKTPGNNNALIIGKFRVLTNEGHVKLIRKAQAEFDKVTICIVTSKDTRNTKNLREKMIIETFPNVHIMHSTNANLARLIQESPININSIYCGSDRIQSYQEQLKYTVGVSISELKRTESDISATKVLSNIKDRSFFELNTPKSIHKFYEELSMES